MICLSHIQGRREPVKALGYFIAPSPSEQTIRSLNRTFAGPFGAWAPDLRPRLPRIPHPPDGPGHTNASLALFCVWFRKSSLSFEPV